MIIVLTPIKNEEWILESFLKTTLKFADRVLIADQNSTDRSVELASRFPNVDIIQNNSGNYDEASRQILLIATARAKYGSNNILLALDADEIISFNALKSEEWETIRKAKPGTVLFFEKPTFIQDINHVIRYEVQGGWPLGFVDDGSQHSAKLIHSTRIPFSKGSPSLFLKEIKFLHCNLLNLARQRSKVRYYCLLEAVAKSKPWYHRLIMYNRNYNYIKNEGEGLSSSNSEWTDGWIKNGISFHEVTQEKYYWFDREAIMIISQHGSRQFWLDDVWDIDWLAASNYFKITNSRIKKPSKSFNLVRDILHIALRQAFSIKKLLTK